MAEQVGSGVKTRSKVAQERGSLLAPSKLGMSFRFDTSALSAVEEETGLLIEAVTPPPNTKLHSRQSYVNQSPQTTHDETPPKSPREPHFEQDRQEHNTVDSPMRLGTPHTRVAAKVQTPEDYCHIDNALVVCCAKCGVIFQRINASTHCPLCRLHSSGVLEYGSDIQRLEIQLAQIEGHILNLSKKLNDLQLAIVNYKTPTHNTRDNLAELACYSNDPGVDLRREGDIGKPAEGLYGQTDSKLRELFEIHRTFEGEQAMITQKLAMVEQIAVKAEQSIAKIEKQMSNDPNEKNSLAQVDISKPSTAYKQQRGKVAFTNKRVLLAGDTNASRFFDWVKGMLYNPENIEELSSSGQKFAETVRSCKDWLQDTEGLTQIVIHSGLDDIISEQVDNKETLESLKNRITVSLTDLAALCGEKGSLLKICSIPEVVNYSERYDWRQPAFELNAMLKTLAEELRFEFVDLTDVAQRNIHIMNREGINYNRYGQELIANLIAESVGKWLGIAPSKYRKGKPLAGWLPQTGDARRENSARRSGRNVYMGHGFNAAGGLSEEYRFLPRRSEHVKGEARRDYRYTHNPYAARKSMLRPRTRDAHLSSHLNTLRYIPMELNPWMPGFAPWGR